MDSQLFAQLPYGAVMETSETYNVRELTSFKYERPEGTLKIVAAESYAAFGKDHLAGIKLDVAARVGLSANRVESVRTVDKSLRYVVTIKEPQDRGSYYPRKLLYVQSADGTVKVVSFWLGEFRRHDWDSLIMQTIGSVTVGKNSLRRDGGKQKMCRSSECETEIQIPPQWAIMPRLTNEVRYFVTPIRGIGERSPSCDILFQGFTEEPVGTPLDYRAFDGSRWISSESAKVFKASVNARRSTNFQVSITCTATSKSELHEVIDVANRVRPSS